MPSMTEDETVKLDKLKGERSQLRRVFTNAARRFSDVLESTDIQTKDISSGFNKVIEKAERLFKVDEEIKAVTFEYTDEEFDIIESYRDKLTEIKSKYSKHLQEDFKHPEDDVRSTSSKVGTLNLSVHGGPVEDKQDISWECMVFFMDGFSQQNSHGTAQTYSIFMNSDDRSSDRHQRSPPFYFFHCLQAL
ncbi:hypothetical protein JTE90_029252 [Oedothorax gibbosus]|uniref:Uncharacterized protein n=1 Tax=Oedothorax gibbosus TaxID=931172 RepID=A0AAV6TUI2_9ARAC|nr:hypothetical protein JTE90_029252 [Oedothorax gibbosus]